MPSRMAETFVSSGRSRAGALYSLLPAFPWFWSPFQRPPARPTPPTSVVQAQRRPLRPPRRSHPSSPRSHGRVVAPLPTRLHHSTSPSATSSLILVRYHAPSLHPNETGASAKDRSVSEGQFASKRRRLLAASPFGDVVYSRGRSKRASRTSKESSAGESSCFRERECGSASAQAE